MIGESINFMILGMATVFCFLLIMILILRIQAYIIGRLFGDDSFNRSTETIVNDKKKVAIISAAIKKHKES
ncbi:OadG family protein [bacterium]|nr:OadG family protein [bacterium]NSW74162.1 OadG family protein [bacterium]